jgi:general stress protein 26
MAAKPMSALSQLSPDLVAMMARGVSVNVASRGASLRPSVMRAMASSVDAAAGTVTVYLARRQSAQLLRDIESTGCIAAIFSEPSTHITVQLKATATTLRDAKEEDRPALERYLASMEQEILRVGHPPPVTRAMLSWRLDDLVAVTFAPEQVFEQTPGSKAGKLMAGGA